MYSSPTSILHTRLDAIGWRPNACCEWRPKFLRVNVPVKAECVQDAAGLFTRDVEQLPPGRRARHRVPVIGVVMSCRASPLASAWVAPTMRGPEVGGEGEVEGSCVSATGGGGAAHVDADDVLAGRDGPPASGNRAEHPSMQVVQWYGPRVPTAVAAGQGGVCKDLYAHRVPTAVPGAAAT